MRVDIADDRAHRPKSTYNQATGRDTNANLVFFADDLWIPLDPRCSASSLTTRDSRPGLRNPTEFFIEACLDMEGMLGQVITF